jgi:hypothetical protein
MVQGSLKMAKSNDNGKWTKKAEYGQDASFADVKLNASEKDVFLSWVKSTDANCIDSLEALIADSYRVSVKYDYQNSCVTVTLTQQDTKHRNSGLVIMSRSDNVDAAILLSGYKVFVLFEGQRLPTRSEDNSWG